jgi:nitrogen regulatory protein P-II 1
MKKIEAMIRPEKLELLRVRLDEIGYPGMSVSKIDGHGTQRGVSHQFRGLEYKTPFISKTRIEIVAADSQVKKIVEAIMEICRSGSVGDGKIFVSPIDDVYRIRTGEQGDKAL